jgi:uncharacterized RDD family membrane protein YckC
VSDPAAESATESAPPEGEPGAEVQPVDSATPPYDSAPPVDPTAAVGYTPPGYYTPPAYEQVPPGFVPPPGYAPPPGYTPPPGQTPPPGWTPQPAPGMGQGPYQYAGWKPYAGFWRRFAAIIIDGIVLNIGLSIVNYGILGAALGWGGDGRSTVFDLIRVAALWLYFTLMEASPNQGTLGKMALGIVVTDMDGQRISWGRANARFWSKILSYVTIMIGFIMAGFTAKKQGLHDMIAATLVVRKNY